MPTANAPIIVTGAPAWRARVADMLRGAGLPTPQTLPPAAAGGLAGVVISDLRTLPQLSAHPLRATLALVRADDDLMRALELGADDAEVESASPIRLRARVSAAQALANARIPQPTLFTDERTGAVRAEVFHFALGFTLATAERLGLPLSLVHLEPTGTARPDEAAVNALRSVVRRRTDLIGACGTYLSVLLPHTPHADALRLAADMRSALRSIPPRGGRRVTYGIGVATTVEDNTERLTERAREACRASQAARGRVNGEPRG